MKRLPRSLLRLAALVTAVSACASAPTDTRITGRQLPAVFAEGSPGPSVAGTSWKDWFGVGELNRLVGEALGNNLDLRIALQRMEITRAAARAATGALLPRVALVMGGGVRKLGRYTSEGAGNATTEITPGRLIPVPETDMALGLQASWEVDLWGRFRNQRESAAARYLASVEGTNLVLTSLVADVASAYYELLALDHLAEVLGQSVARQQQAVEVIRLQKQAGRANELAVQQFEAQLAETQALQREVSGNISNAENRVNVLLGRYPQPLRRSKAVLFHPSPKLPTGLPAELLANRPDIRQAEQEVRASKFDVKAARAAFFPSLTLNAGVGLQAFNPEFLVKLPQSLTYSVSGGLLAPLVNRRAIEAQFAGAQANQIEAIYNYQRTILNAYVEVANALSQIHDLEKILAFKQAQKAAMVEAASTADLLYRAGKATYLEVLLAQQGALRSDLDLIDTWKRRHVADIVAYRALGGGWR